MEEIKLEVKMSGQTKYPWHNGYWFNQSQLCLLTVVKQNLYEEHTINVLDYPDMVPKNSGTWTYGEYENAPLEIFIATGIKKYNLKMTGNCQPFGTICKNKTQIYFLGLSNKIEVLSWKNEQDIEKIKKDRDDMEVQNCQYFKPLPDEKGKLVWISGGPGTGKSTTAQFMGRNHGFLYYEGDCFPLCVNPFVDVNAENPSLAVGLQKPLKNIGKETINAINFARKSKIDILKEGTSVTFEEAHQSLYDCRSRDILRQWARIGGNMVVAQAVFSRNQRDKIRNIVGNDVIFIILNMTKTLETKRREERHGNSITEDYKKILSKFSKWCEHAGTDEKNAYNIKVNENMTIKEVTKEILKCFKSAAA